MCDVIQNRTHVKQNGGLEWKGTYLLCDVIQNKTCVKQDGERKREKKILICSTRNLNSHFSPRYFNNKKGNSELSGEYKTENFNYKGPKRAYSPHFLSEQRRITYMLYTEVHTLQLFLFLFYIYFSYFHHNKNEKHQHATYFFFVDSDYFWNLFIDRHTVQS